MAEVTALEKHPCPACGAQAEWHPSESRLVCPYCGTSAPAGVDAGGAVQELDLAATLRDLPDEQRGWQTERQAVRCQSCQAVSVFDPGRVGQRCDFCGSPQIVPYEEVKAPIRPESVLPFTVGQGAVRDSLRRWFGSRWFAPGALGRAALIDTVHGVYLPYWTFDAQARCPWTAEAGHYYYETETYRDAHGKNATRQVRHVRWVPASGVVEHFFDDKPVPGTRGVARKLLAGAEPFPFDRLKPYDTSYLSGFTVEHYQVVLFDAADEARAAMVNELRAMCSRAVPGDTQRNLQIRPEFSGQTFKHLLAPVWLLSYDFGPRAFQVVVNGVTGKIAGDYPKSAWKIFFLVVAILAALALVLFLGQGG
jgi:hypothetical protein